MKRFSLSLILGFITNNLFASLIAMFFLNPLLNSMFNGIVRSPKEGLKVFSLLSGYFLLTLFMVIRYKYFSLKQNWLKKGVIWGAFIGFIIFISGHLIVAGWAKTPLVPMFISGIFDSLSTIATGVVIAYIYKNE